MKSALKSKLKYIIVISLTASVLVGVCVAYILNFHSALSKDNQAYFNEVAYEAASSLENKLDNLVTSLEQQAVEITYINFLTHEEQRAALAALLKNNRFTDVIYIDFEGSAISAVHEVTASLSRRDYFQQALRGRSVISGMIISEFDEQRINVCAVPVRDPKGRTYGVLAASIGEELKAELMYSETFSSKASNLIMDSHGIITLSCPNNAMLMDAGISLLEAVDLTSGKNADMVLEGLAERNTKGDFTFLLEGEEYYASYTSINISDWLVLTLVNSSDVHKLTDNVFVMTLLFTAGVIIVIAGGFIFAGMRNWSAGKKQNETMAELEYFKYYDTLTGSPSYDKFIRTVNELFIEFSADAQFAAISLDINKFRTVNDHLGHDEGSKILIKLAGVIKRNIRDDETYCRVNADLFYIMIKFESDEDIFSRINTIINDTYYQIEEFKLCLLFGIYKIEDKEMDIRSVLDRSDLARRTIKDKNDSSYTFFDVNMLSKIREEKRIENIMEFALESNEFKVFLQPKYDLQNRETVIGAEALIRWFRDGKMIPPGGFIPIFEKNGFILKTDLFVFEEVCKQQKTWLARGYEMHVISVNMSRVNVKQPDFVRNLYNICTKYNVPTKWFEIEITESVAFENLEVLTRVFNELKNYGFHISIDDFGTGYSSLNMLKNLPVDVLKLDRAFLSESGKNERANNIIKHVIQLALSLHMKTICEGIETLDQVNLLSRLGCDMAQGFYFARPMPIEEYEKLLYGNVDSKV